MFEIKIQRRIGEFELDVEFAAPEGKIVVLFGPSGAGKSMSLASIAGFVTPDAGRIAANSRVLYDSARGIDLPPQKRRIGLVKQDLTLFPHLRVAQNVAYGLVREPPGTRRDRVRALLHLVGLDGLEDRYPAQLSGGQQQRVALARALAPDPELLLLDEPFSALDAPTRVQLRNDVLALQRQIRVPIVFVTHDLGEAYFLADRLAVIDGGRIWQVDSPGEILQHPSCLRVARAVGVKNVLAGTVLECGPSHCRVRVGQVILDTTPGPFEAGAPVHVCLRPERVMLLRPERGAESSDENALRGTIVRESNDGMMATLFFRSEQERLAEDQDYDLQIELPVYIYERLELARRREWNVSLRKNAIHLIGS
ncbi:MAG: ABC transporter ATP-binding protein [Chloroflexi bacterium]|nr:ABC transporter ATP-binding protein [Chloroflexota bacterium]